VTELTVAVVAALRRRGHTILTRPARLDRRGAALAELCEMREEDRAWDPHWDQCPYRVIGYLDPGHLSHWTTRHHPISLHDIRSA
jgi:hypothetical protein